MGVAKEKRPDLDPPHSKSSRDGAHIVSCDFDAKSSLLLRSNLIFAKYADVQLFHSLEYDEQAVRTARQL